MCHLCHVCYHLFCLLSWPTLHAEHLPQSSRVHIMLNMAASPSLVGLFSVCRLRPHRIRTSASPAVICPISVVLSHGPQHKLQHLSPWSTQKWRLAAPFWLLLTERYRYHKPSFNLRTLLFSSESGTQQCPCGFVTRDGSMVLMVTAERNVM
jgi:hypothetical protein